MKRKDNNQSLGDAIKSLFSNLGIEDKIMSLQAEEAFEKMMGGYIMSYVETSFIKDKVLFIKIKSPELKNELQYGKTKILEHINGELGKEYLTEVKFI